MLNKNTKFILITILAALINAFAVKVFLKPLEIVPLGVPGASILIQKILQTLHITFEYYYIFLLINIVLGVWGWFIVSKQLVIKTFFYVLMFTLFSRFIPTIHISNDKLLLTIFAGVFNALTSSLLLYIGSSIGGFTMIGIYLSKKFNKNIVGKTNMFINFTIILIFSLYTSIESGMYSIILSYISSFLIDKWHRQSNYVTLLLITKKTNIITEYINSKVKRTGTIINSIGSYSREENNTIIVTLSKANLEFYINDLKKIDEKIYINILKTDSIIGNSKSDVGTSLV